MENFLDYIRNTKDMLNGNINRMCVTTDIKELNDMYKAALVKIENIYARNIIRLKKGDL